MTRSINEVDRMHTYFYLKLKYPVFFIFSLFSSTKSENRRVQNKPYLGGRAGISGSGEVLGKWGRGQNMVQ
jgi:hypothetical protein